MCRTKFFSPLPIFLTNAKENRKVEALLQYSNIYMKHGVIATWSFVDRPFKANDILKPKMMQLFK